MNEIKLNENSVVINGITYFAEGTQNKNFDGDIKIVVLQRGWIYIGRFERTGNDCKLYNSYCIRKWGTSKGLAELVNGPTEKTVLDKCEGMVEFDWLNVIHVITVNNSWKNLI
jgi:hypothetical protein